MCGIAGIVSRDPSLRDRRSIELMCSALRHRGPDDEGIESRGIAVLGARRLSIIDLERGHQPMSDESGRIWAVQNGEIYNFQELRADLVSRGHVFRTRNDTEILPHAYEEWGDGCVERLRGMFALAIWDDARERLLLARDRFGKKPLVYARVGDALLFASEIQGLLAHPAVSREVDPNAIADYLALGYVPAPLTAFAQIRKVAPAHTLTFERGSVAVARYWQLRFAPKRDMSLEDASRELRDRIDEAVRIRLVSDVPLGAFLSGGLDSSTVVAFMARHTAQPVKTFSIGFTDQDFDELRYARIVAQRFGTDHHEFVVDVEQSDVLPDLIRHVGEPFADSSIVPTYHVARITRPHVTVVLNGDGGDEIFAGYDRYKAAAMAQRADRLAPLAARAALSRLAAAVPRIGGLPRFVGRARRFLVAVGQDPDERYVRWSGYFTGPLRAAIVGDRLREVAGSDLISSVGDAVRRSGATDPAERYMAADVDLGLPGDLLVKMDIATMASSLEARSPFLDHELASFVSSLPARYKLAGVSKVLLRHAMRGILPPEILGRGKMGFTAPVGAWLRGPLRSRFEDLVLSSRAAARGFVSVRAAESLYRAHLDRRADHTHLLWSLLVLETWFRECVDEAPSGGERPVEVREPARL